MQKVSKHFELFLLLLLFVVTCAEFFISFSRYCLYSLYIIQICISEGNKRNSTFRGENRLRHKGLNEKERENRNIFVYTSRTNRRKGLHGYTMIQSVMGRKFRMKKNDEGFRAATFLVSLYILMSSYE